MDPATTSTIIGLSVAIVILIMCSAFFSATETAYSSMNRIKLKSMAQDGNKKAKRALLISEDYDKFLTTILIGNNIVNIAGASLATILFGLLIQNQELSVTISTVVMTILTLIFGEISPKSLAKESPEGFAMGVSSITQVLIIIISPIAWIFGQWKKLLVLIFKPKQTEGISEAELITMVDEATTGGNFDKEEGELIRSAIEFNELTVRDIYTPRVDMITAEVDIDKEELRALFNSHGFSRIPIYEDDVDHIIGVLHEKDFYSIYFEKDFCIKSCMSNVICVTLNADLSQVLKTLQKSKTHLAIVIDEYGGTAGLITLEDILEELVGEIWDEHDEITIDVETLSQDEYNILGSYDVEEFFDLVGLDYDEDEIESTTVSGWLVDQFGYVPKVNDEFNYEHIFIKILSTDTRKIEKIYVKVNEKEKKENNNFLDKLFIREDKEKDF